MIWSGGKSLKRELKRYFEEISDLPFNKWDDGQILLFHSYIHREFSRNQSSSFIELHKLVYEEMCERGIKHSQYDDLDQEVQYVKN